MSILTGDIIIGQLQQLYRDSSHAVETEVYNLGFPDYDETYYFTRKSTAALCFLLINSAVEKNLLSVQFEYSTDLSKDGFRTLYWTFDAMGVSLHEHGIDVSGASAEGMKFALLSALEDQQFLIELERQGRPEREVELSKLENKNIEGHNIAVDFIKKCLG